MQALVNVVGGSLQRMTGFMWKQIDDGITVDENARFV